MALRKLDSVFYRRVSLDSEDEGVRFTVSGAKLRGVGKKFKTEYTVVVENGQASERISGSLGKVSIGTLDILGMAFPDRFDLKAHAVSQLIQASNAIGDTDIEV